MSREMSPEEWAQFLKIMSMNLYDMETGSRSVKVVYRETLCTVIYVLNKYFPKMSVPEKQDFVYTFFRSCLGFIPIR